MQKYPDNQSKIYQGDCREKLDMFDANTFQAIIADPPYFQVLLGEDWDNQWRTEEDYLNWTEDWIKKSAKLLKDDGLFLSLGNLANANISGFTFVRWQPEFCRYRETAKYESPSNTGEAKDARVFRAVRR